MTRPGAAVAGFAAALVLAFGAAYGVGAAVGPLGEAPAVEHGTDPTGPGHPAP